MKNTPVGMNSYWRAAIYALTFWALCALAFWGMNTWLIEHQQTAVMIGQVLDKLSF